MNQPGQPSRSSHRASGRVRFKQLLSPSLAWLEQGPICLIHLVSSSLSSITAISNVYHNFMANFYSSKTLLWGFLSDMAQVIDLSESFRRNMMNKPGIYLLLNILIITPVKKIAWTGHGTENIVRELVFSN